MALNSILDFSQTPGSNQDFAGTSVLGTGLVSTADDSFRNLASFLARFRDDLGGAATTSGTNTITVTANQAFTAYAAGQRFLFKLGGTNTGAATLNITPSGGSALGAKNIKIVTSGTARDPIAGELVSGNYAEFQYDGTNMNLLSQAGGVASNLLSNDPFYNLSLSVSVAANALTIALKGADGNDPSASNPVYVSFRSATATAGTSSLLTVTAATSLVVSSGSTLGTSNGVAATLAVVAFNDAGTFRLGIINPQALPLIDSIASSTAEGGAGAADSQGIFYTGTAVSSKSYTVLGFITITEATAGTWASAPTVVQVGSAPATNNANAYSLALSGNLPTIANNGSDATNDIDFAAGYALDLSIGGYAFCQALTKQLDANWAPGTNQGMRYSGAAITNTTYHLWACWKDSGAQDYYADPSATQSTVLTHLQAETGGASYTHLRRIASIVRSGGSISAFSQFGNEFLWGNVVADVSANSSSSSAITRTLTVPTGIIVYAMINVFTVNTDSGTADSRVVVSPLDTVDQAPGNSTFNAGGLNIATGQASAQYASTQLVRTNTSAQIRTRNSSASANMFLAVSTRGYMDLRGRV